MQDKPTARPSLLSRLAPGLLVAATGVGAGDLLTASHAGSKCGTVILWAALAGALLKWVLNEGIARWQMATGTTLLEGWTTRLGPWIRWVFLLYLTVWAFAVGGALTSACGAAGSAFLQLTDDPKVSKIIWGVGHSFLGLALVWLGGFRLFEKLMSACIVVMFVAVLLTAVLLRPGAAEILRGSVLPTVPVDGMAWVLGVLGGVGGTVTLMCYGYWIREEGRTGIDGLRACRLDLAVGYAMTAFFGMAMIVIGSRFTLESGSNPALVLASALEEALGPVGRPLFLVGFWGAVFSSLLGVWQSVPYLFADFVALSRGLSAETRRTLVYRRTPAYRAYLLAIATVPLILLQWELARIQLLYAVLGALFMPLLALTLLILNNRRQWVGPRFASGWVVNALLALTLLFFVWVGAKKTTETVAEYQGKQRSDKHELERFPAPFQTAPHAP